MSTPPIQYSGPNIAPDVDWEIRRHLQLLYQKLGNHTQAFALQSKQIAAIKAGGSTTTSIELAGGSSGSPGTIFLGQGLINNQTGETSYATGPGDNGILLILDDVSAVAVTLTTDASPLYIVITNFGAGTATLTPSTGTINGGATLTLLQNQTVLASCDSTNWSTTALAGTPQTIAPVTGEYLTGFNAATGLFSQSTPAGISATITTAKLTTGGTNGSMTFVGGLLTASTPAT